MNPYQHGGFIVGARVRIKPEFQYNHGEFGTIVSEPEDGKVAVLPENSPYGNNMGNGWLWPLKGLELAGPYIGIDMGVEFTVDDRRVPCVCGRRARMGDYLCGVCRG